MRRTLSVRLSVRPVIVTERHVAPPSLKANRLTLKFIIKSGKQNTRADDNLY